MFSLVTLHHSEIVLPDSEIVKRCLKCRCDRPWPQFHPVFGVRAWPPCNIMHCNFMHEPRTVFLFDIKVVPKQNLFCVGVMSCLMSLFINLVLC